MKKHSSPLSDYYQEEKFNPTFIDYSSKEYINKQYAKRYNLYCNKLKLLPLLFNNANCLEFGCSSGENSLFLASLGTKFVFVDPHLESTERLTNLFHQKKLANHIISIHNDIIENYHDEKQYDFVIAEGFLNYVPTKNEELRKILRMLKNNGMSIISSADPYGQFIQLIKTIIFKVLCSSQKANVYVEQLKIAYDLFEKEYIAIPHSRPFELYVRDTFLNPYFGSVKYWGFEEMLPIVIEENCNFFSSWPYYGNNDNLLWHKHISSLEHLKEEYLKRYILKAPNFIASEELNVLDLKWARDFLNAVSKLINSLENNVQQGYINSFSINKLDRLNEIICSKYPNSRTATVVSEIKKVFCNLLNEKYNDFIKTYNNSLLISTWGMPYHYFCYNKVLTF